MKTYNVLGELTVCILSFILLINFVMTFKLNERRQKIYLHCILAVLFSTLLNMASIELIIYFKPSYYYAAKVVTTLYFCLLTVPAVMFAAYTYEFSSVEKKHRKYVAFLLYVPYLIYLAVVLLNLKFNWLFYYSLETGYHRGYLKNITYWTTMIYVVEVIGFTLRNRKNLSKKIVIIFCLYPVLSSAVISIQFFAPHLIMSGASAFTPMLLAYLGIQSDLLDYDLSTGLMTEKNLANLLNKTRNQNQKPLNIVVISIENFYTIFETIGYNDSNILLLQIAQKLSAHFPKSVYHISTDRFAVVGKNMNRLKEIILKLTEEFRNLQVGSNELYHIDIRSIGLTVPGNAKNYNNAMELVSEMFSNIQKNKINKDVKFLLCDEIYEDKVRRNNMIKEILERELKVDSKMYQVYFQPIYSIGQEKFLYAEALSRLLDTEIGTIRPDEFITVAESKGLIERLGNVAFEKICKFISENQDKVHAVSVNFSVNQLINPYIVENVLGTIEKYNIKPENIIMEITESIFIEDFELIKDKMKKLSDAGIIFYLDDFGTGYSNFANVIDLPFTTIKIDRSMVLSMEHNEKSRQLIFSLINAFKQNGLKILVEGVENLTQDKLVREAGADYIQGFLYKRPVCGKECLDVLA